MSGSGASADPPLLVVLRSPDSAPRRYTLALLPAGPSSHLAGEVVTSVPLEAAEPEPRELARHLTRALVRDAPPSLPAQRRRGWSSRREEFLWLALAHIDDHLHDPLLSPVAVAAAVHVSPRYLHAIFSTVGTTVSRHVQARRLEVGRELLSQPAMRGVQVAEIARHVGFSDPSHFARVFKAAYGETPRTFRLRVTRDEP